MSKIEANNRSAPELGLVPGSHPCFRVADITHASEFLLSSGARLTIARNPKGILLVGEYGGKIERMALSEEATEVMLGALLLSRPEPAEPLPNAKLLPFANAVHEPTGPATQPKGDAP